MIVKTFAFSRVQKTLQGIEDQLNEFLEQNTLKFATQNESAVKGKFIVSLYHEPKKGNIRAKVFKSQDLHVVDDQINEFLKDRDMKLVTSTFVGSTVYVILFYIEKAADKTPAE